MNNCPFCSNQMLRHIGNQRVYWYCPSCHQEVPNLQTIITGPKSNRARPAVRS